MATRSRKGCIDCKQAKIKCDEVHPFCGTCTRRRRQCRGYSFPLNNRSLLLRETRPAAQAQAPVQTQTQTQTQTRSQVQTPWPSQTGVLPDQQLLLQPGTATFAAATAAAAAASIAAASYDATSLPFLRPNTLLPGLPWTSSVSASTSPAVPASASVSAPAFASAPAPFTSWTTGECTELTDEEAQSLSLSSSQPVISSSSSSSSSIIYPPAVIPSWIPAPTRGLSWIPGDITAADRPFIEIYFVRHPLEMVMSNDFFITEMNAVVLSLMQQSPADVCDSLSAIGENYLKDTSSSALVSNRKSRLLSRLQRANERGSSPELVLLILLALCGAELTDPFSDGMGTSLRALIENVALTLEFYGRTGSPLNDEAKYFTRGIARQDLLISLARMQRPRIDPMLWLDEHSMTRADRLFGLTTTLTPVLAQLAGLAEDVQAALDDAVSRGLLAPLGEYCPREDGPADGDAASASASASASYPTFPDYSVGSHYMLTQREDLAEREASVRAQLLAWRPVNDTSLSLRASRKFLLHASAWRSAALLYLFRLFNRAGSAPAADNAAQGMAYEVMMHVSGQPEDTKLSLWPLFVAACEMDRPEDRDTATQLFDSVCHTRPLLTAIRTRALCTDHIWPARDRGDIWDWMYLARQSSYVYIPL